ncbi:MAG TPA: endo-1,4-beta-xylanase [Candidatus Marinimicrobia bacterium]|nr:endo-1,4-beta-xylanase [Candidatus Neomarinimicrobiota bacterium]
MKSFNSNHNRTKSAILSLILVLSSMSAYAQTSTIQTDVPALKDVYANDFYIGCLLSYPHIGLPDDPAVPGQGAVVDPDGGYLIKFHMNSMSPGNNMKPIATIDTYNSALAYNNASSEDKDSVNTHPIVRFNGNLIAQLNWAQRQGFTFRGHTLVWHSQTPRELFKSGYTDAGDYLSKGKMIERMDNYIGEVIRLIHADWPGLLTAIDVVNEAVYDDGYDRTSSDWYIVFGDNSYIMKAFELTRKWTEYYGEDQIKLYYNDYNTHNPAKADGIVRICAPIFEAGYLDGIGMQDHDQYNSPTAEQWIASYDKFTAISDEIAVTELDVKPSTVTATRWTTQANQYAALFKCFVERSMFSGRGKIISVSKDGLNDTRAFVPEASLWDADNQCKPAFYAVVDVGKYYNSLDSLIAIGDTIQESNYTAETWANFTASLASARTAIVQNYSYSVSAAEALGEALISLDEAIDGLLSVDAAKPVIVEAESGEVGTDFNILLAGDVEYVTIQTNSTAYHPGSRARMISYEVTFPDTGTYDLFARIRVGSGTFDDDSFFYSNGFGIKDSLNDSDWISINGLAVAGFSGANEVVREAGGLGSGVWKWVNLSRNAYQSSITCTFTIADSLTRIFQIGAREDGLDFDKFAFGKSFLYYTVGNLDNQEPGSIQMQGEIWEGPPLASKQTKFVGNVHSSAQAYNFTAYWNQVTPENAGKWASVEGTRDVMNWSGLDAAYNLAKDNDFPFHFHVLIWGAQQPSWISSLAAEEQLEEITEWFQAVADRYPEIDYLEVVNEPLPGHNPPDGTNGRANYKAALGGDGETGWDWVLNAFRLARQIFPSETKLMLNDFSIINNSSSTAAYLQIIRLLQAEDLIDIIAEQGHAFTTTADVTKMRTNLDSLASTGLPIQITELDIDGTDDAVQLQHYQRIFPALYEHPGVEGITLWGWRRGLWRDAQGAYLINQDGTERPALEWLRGYLDTLSIVVAVKEDVSQEPNVFSLGNNYPNPFNPTTTIRYQLPVTSYLTLKVYNLLGKEVTTLVEGTRQAGNYSVMFDATGLAGGVYLYQLRAGNFVETRKFVLLK